MLFNLLLLQQVSTILRFLPNKTEPCPFSPKKKKKKKKIQNRVWIEF